MKTFPLEVCAHCTDGTNLFSCSPPPQPHLHSYKEAFEEMESASPSSLTSGGGEISPPTPAFPVSPQTPYSDSRKCRGSGRRKGSVGGFRQTRNLPRLRQLRAPDTHCHDNRSLLFSLLLLLLLLLSPSHPTICIPLLAPSCWLFPILRSPGCFCRRDEERGRVREMAPSHACTSPSFLPAWHKSYRAIRGQQRM